MKRRLNMFFTIIAVISFLAFSVVSCGESGSKGVFDITSPYENVNWSAFGQYKAALHSHTTNSDGSVALSGSVDAHYAAGYDILATTDHVWKRVGVTEVYLDFITTDYLQTSYNGTELTSLTAARIAELDAGANRENRPMLLVPCSAELAIGGDPTPDEANVFFWGAGKDTMPAVPKAWTKGIDAGLADANDSGAIFFINHPGRSTNAQNYKHGGASDLANPSNMSTWVRRYVNLYQKYPANTLVGMEIFNRRDQDSRHDRILWDNILKTVIPSGRTIWGYANDDSHSNGAIAVNYNIMLMPENSLTNFRAAMIGGHSYMVTCAAYNERVGVEGTVESPTLLTRVSSSPPQDTNRPRISGITVDKNAETITITATDADRIDWISEGKVIHTTTGGTGTLNLLDAEIEPQVGSYVRANIIGEYGMAVIQPIITKRIADK